MVGDKEKLIFKQGEDIKLTCDVKGYPIPVIKWYKNNTPLPKADRIQVFEDNSVVLTQTTIIDGGSYTCRYNFITYKIMGPCPAYTGGFKW